MMRSISDCKKTRQADRYEKAVSAAAGRAAEKAEQMNRKRQFRMPKDTKARYADRMILDCHCLTMETQLQRSNRALLFLFGGGMLLGADNGDVNAARDIGRRSGRDVWLPYYPLCTGHSMLEATQMVYETYRQMLLEYEAAHIAFWAFPPARDWRWISLRTSICGQRAAHAGADGAFVPRHLPGGRG